MSDTLRDAGYEVDCYCDARLALGSLRAQPADLILLDLRMPEMDGWQFRVAQRADSDISGIPVVIMTGDTSPQAAAIDADGSLNKPVGAAELIATVERVLRNNKRRRFAASLEETSRLASLGTLASGVGHEVNNPLAAAMANLELMQDSLRSLSVELAELDGSRSNAGVREKVALMEEHLGEGRKGLERVRLVVRNLQSVCRRLDDEETRWTSTRSWRPSSPRPGAGSRTVRTSPARTARWHGSWATRPGSRRRSCTC